MKTDILRYNHGQHSSLFLYANTESYAYYCTDKLVKLFSGCAVERVSKSVFLNDPQAIYNQADLFTKTCAGKIIIINQATDRLFDAVQHFLADPPQDTSLVLSALVGDSVKKLRLLHERSTNAALIGCYLSSAQEKQAYIQDLSKVAGVALDHEAMKYAMNAIENDSVNLADDLQKVALFVNSGREITIEDLELCSSASSDSEAMSLVYAVFDRQRPRLLTMYQLMLERGVEVVHILRLLSSHTTRLLALHAQIKEGMSIQQAIDTSRPPIFFKHHNLINRHIKNWQVSKLKLLLSKIREEELQVKSGVGVDAVRLGRLLLALTAGH